MSNRLALAAALLALHATQPAQRPNLDARFIGNMAVALTDGTTTIVSDFPYQSGAFGYMTYDAAEIRSATSAMLALITHRHNDHWEPALFARTSWSVAGPDDVVAGIPAARVVRVRSGATFGAARIESIQTPHANVGHYSYVVTWHGRRIYFSGDTTRRARRSPNASGRAWCRSRGSRSRFVDGLRASSYFRSASTGAIRSARSVGTVQAASDTTSITERPTAEAIATAPGSEPPEPVSSRNS